MANLTNASRKQADSVETRDIVGRAEQSLLNAQLDGPGSSYRKSRAAMPAKLGNKMWSDLLKSQKSREGSSRCLSKPTRRGIQKTSNPFLSHCTAPGTGGRKTSLVLDPHHTASVFPYTKQMP